MARTTTDLLNSIKRRAQLPDDSGTLSDSDILEFASDELLNVVYPRLLAMNEWHYAFSYNETLSSVRTYRVHPRVAGNRIISVEYYDGTNYRFIRLSHPLMQRANNVESYSIYGNQITLSDGCPTSGTLRIRAVLRPSRLVTTGCSGISGTVNTPGFPNVSVTVEDGTQFPSQQFVDVVSASSPYEAIVIGLVGDAAVANVVSVTIAGSIGSTTLDYDAWDPNTIEATARLTPAERSDRVMLPDELHDYLAQRAAIRCMEARGFTGDMNNHLRKLTDMEQAFDRLVAPRSKGEFKAILPEEYFYYGRP